MSVAPEDDSTIESPIPPSLEVVRDLGATSLAASAAEQSTAPKTLYDTLIAYTAEQALAADSLTLPDTPLFAQLTHQVLSERLKAASTHHGYPEETRRINPDRVTRSLDTYFKAFAACYSSDGQPADAYIEKQRQAHLRENIAQAYTVQSFHPQINWLLRIEETLRQASLEVAADATLDLLAAYGWATRSDYEATRLRLLRQTGAFGRVQ